MTDLTSKAFESIKSFSGSAQENARDWCDRAEIIFNAFNIEDNERLARIAIKFEDSAFDWYRDNQGPYPSWAQFRLAFERTFPPPARTQNLHLLAEQINQRKQTADESVHDYFYALDKLCREYDPRMSAIDKTIKLVGGLRPQLKEKILPLNVQTPEEFMQHAKNFESSEKVMMNHHHRIESLEMGEPGYIIESNPYSSTAAVQSHYQNNRYIKPMNVNQFKRPIGKFQRPQQLKYDQNYPSRNQAQSSTLRYHDRPTDQQRRNQEDRRFNATHAKCFRCGQFGHYQRNCTNHLNGYEDQ